MDGRSKRIFIRGVIVLSILPVIFLLVHTLAMHETGYRLQERQLKNLVHQISSEVEQRGMTVVSIAGMASRFLPGQEALFEKMIQALPGGQWYGGLALREADGTLLSSRTGTSQVQIRIQADRGRPEFENETNGYLVFSSAACSTPCLVARAMIGQGRWLSLYFSSEVLGLEYSIRRLRSLGIRAVLTLENRQIFASSFQQRLEGLPLSVLLPIREGVDGTDKQDFLPERGRKQLLIVTNGAKQEGINMETVWETIRFPGERLRLYLLTPEERALIDARPSFIYTIFLHAFVVVISLVAIGFFIFLYRRLGRIREDAAQIPELRQNVTRLKETSLRYSTLFNSMIDGILLLDMHGRILDCNRTFAEMLGYETGELIGTNQRLLTPPRFWQTENESVFAQVSSWGFTKDYEKEFIRKDGSTVPVMINSCLIRESDSKNGSILSTLRDISEQKRALDEINRLNLLLEDIIESSTLCILTLDERLRIRMVNSSAERFFRIERAMVMGSPLFESIPFFERLRSLFERTISENKPMFQGNETVVFGENDEKHVNITIYPLHSRESGSVAIHLEDITDHVHLERRLFQSQKMEALGTLASGFAHDFNNLLSGIFSYLTVIKMKTTDEEVLEPLDLVYSIAKRASTLVKHIVTFSRSSQIRAVPVNIGSVIDEVVAMIRESFPKNIDLQTVACDDDCWILGDQSQIAQVLLNLCINARDAMPSGGVLAISLERLRISEEDARRFRLLKPGNTVRVTVSDTGMGIDPAIADKIFDPFFTTKSDRNGTGMGLFIVYGILRSHRGDIELSSTPGKGTSISIFIPLSEPPENGETLPENEACSQKTGNTELRGRLVVIDDEEIIGGALREGFSRMGFEVRTALNGAEGLRLCRESRPDMVILDMIMPGLGGEETFDLLKAEYPDLKIVIHTGFTQGDVEQRMLEKGALDVLHKPYEMTEVAQRLAAWIRQGQAQGNP